MNAVDRFCEYLNSHLGDIYVWGAQGEKNPTKEWIRSVETSQKNADRAIEFMEKQIEWGRYPIYAFDCSGLIVRFLLDENLIDNDLTSRGLFSICEEKTRDELQRGDFVFRHNGTKIHHVGVYVGDNMVIEAMGRDMGVVKRDIDASGEGYWNRYGRFPKLFEDELYFPATYQYTGATFVNLRKTPGGEIIGRVSRDETVIVLEINDGYADIIKVENGRYVRGYCVATWLTRLED